MAAVTPGANQEKKPQMMETNKNRRLGKLQDYCLKASATNLYFHNHPVIPRSLHQKRFLKKVQISCVNKVQIMTWLKNSWSLP